MFQTNKYMFVHKYLFVYKQYVCSQIICLFRYLFSGNTYLFSENMFMKIYVSTNFVRTQTYICFRQYLFVCNKYVLPTNKYVCFSFRVLKDCRNNSTLILL